MKIWRKRGRELDRGDVIGYGGEKNGQRNGGRE